jgi:hypothetical protein
VSGYLNSNLYKRFNYFMASVVSGQAGVARTILVFSACAFLLLFYVTTQIYAGVLTERIAELEQKQLVVREQYHTLTGNYTRLASRERIGTYCEKVLGMVEADNETMRRVAVDTGNRRYPEHGEFAAKRSFVPEALGYASNGTTRKE